MTITTAQPVLILGMHRSGTSCMAGCLQEAGLYLGTVNTKAGFNTKGNREHRAVMELHEHILNQNNASWDHPPATPVNWQDNELSALVKIAVEFPTHQIWGAKDPRTLFTYLGWQTIFKPKYIGTFRHPQEVAASLIRRAKAWGHHMDKSRAFEIWLAYNQQMLRLHDHNPFDIIRFDIDKQSYSDKLAIAGQKLGLTMPANLKFRESDLRHERHPDSDIPAQLVPVWEALNARAL